MRVVVSMLGSFLYIIYNLNSTSGFVFQCPVRNSIHVIHIIHTMHINTSDIHIIIPKRKTRDFYEIIRNDNLTCYVKKVELRLYIIYKKEPGAFGDTLILLVASFPSES